MKPSAALDQARDVLADLSLEEKVSLLHGRFQSGGVPRLGIPCLVCADGPVGIRTKRANLKKTSPTNEEVQTDDSISTDKAPTALPATLSLAATFNVDSAREYGALLGREALALGIHVIFGPGINLMRDPRCGRNFEYMGEDPYLTGTMAAAYIRGMQRLGVAACAKHYFANDADAYRHFMSSNLDDHTAWETHLRPFAMVCRDADVWSIMTGNNLINGHHVSENPGALSAVLRDRLEWDGVILTDWRAAYDPRKTAEAGVDMTAGICEYVYGDGRLLELVRSGTIPESLVDQSALHVLLLYARTGVMDAGKRMKGEISTPSHHGVARRLAAEGMVLLKNDGPLLPLDAAKTRKLLVTGPAAESTEAGGGSSLVAAGTQSVTPLAGIEAAFPHTEILHEPDTAKAIRIATDVDAILFCARSEATGEGMDLDSIRLVDSQEDDIALLADANPNLAVIIQCGSAVDMNAWIDRPKAVLVAWFGGQMLGLALGDILAGTVNPSGKLPCTFARGIEHYPCATLGLWPARLIVDQVPKSAGFTPEERKAIHAFDADYTEGVFIGYRWFERQGIKPLFPFGYGLSYTTFAMSDVSIKALGRVVRVECTVTNTGSCAGREVVQVYVAPPESAVQRPAKELKGFIKIALEAGASQHVVIPLPEDALSRYEPATGQWTTDPGSYEFQVGTSSRHIVFRSTISSTDLSRGGVVK